MGEGKAWRGSIVNLCKGLINKQAIMDKKAVAGALDDIGALMEILGENPFKVRALVNAARAVETFTGDLKKMADEGRLTEIKGVGESIAGKITTLINTGSLPELAELKSRIPAGVFEMLKIPGLGPKRAKALWDSLGVTAVRELEYACNENRLVELPGFGAKSQENILQGINALHKFAGRRLLSEGMGAVGPLIEWVRGSPAVIRAQVAGSVRRGLETVKDIDIVASAADLEIVMERFVAAPGVTGVIARGHTKTSVRMESGFQADIRVVTDGQFPFALHHFTGSREHNTIMRSLAKTKGLKMNEYGLFKGEQGLPLASEEEIFRALGLSYIPPEMREGFDEVSLAGEGQIPTLIEEADITGVFHVHTDKSDGVDTLAAMAQEAIRLGYKYMGVSDHSKTASYAGGLSAADLLRQGEEIDKLNEKLKGRLHLFKGVESDILSDGSLDYPDRILATLDFVIASVHSRFQKDERAMTERIVTTINNPYTTMLGHPTGRLLLAREGYPLDMEKVVEAMAEHGVHMELNANPHRLDVDWRVMGLVKKAGVKISINPDAHRKEGLQDMRYGLLAARKGGLAKKDVFNTLPLEKIKAELLSQISG
jgi:DNA polymerase (family 10)